MKFIPEVSFTELMKDESLSGLTEYITARLKEQGQDLDQLWAEGKTKKIEQFLPSGQWKSFEKLWLDKINQARENMRKPITKAEMEDEIKKLRSNDLILQTAEALRKIQNKTQGYVRPFNSDWLSPAQLSLLCEAKAALVPSGKKISEQNRLRRVGKKLKDVTKEQLEKFREAFKKNNKGRERGWIKAACIEFNISGKTLSNRMRE